MSLASLKRSELTTTNYHPNYFARGPQRYSGYRFKDVLSRFKLDPNQPITIVGKTGQFSVELKAGELMGDDILLASHLNGVAIKTAENGLQIVYGEKTLAKYPHLKQRQFWCWWIRSLLLDGKSKPALAVKADAAAIYKSPLPWPTPYGISSFGTGSSELSRRGRALFAPKGVRVSLLNGAEIEIVPQPGNKLILTAAPNQKAGGFSLHEVQENAGRVGAFLSNVYYVQSVKAIQ